jgi:hypothetical protein
MGKNRVIKSLGNIIGNVVLHKIKLKHTNMPESTNHLFFEIGTYRDNALEIAQQFNWNESDKQRIKQESIKEFNKRIKKYPDVKFTKEELNSLIDETINGCIS